MAAVQRTRPIPRAGDETEQIGVVGGVLVSVAPRRRIRSQGDVVRLIIGLALIGLGLIMNNLLRNTIGGAEADLVEVYEQVPDRLSEALTGIAVFGAVVVPVVAFVVMLVRRRYRRAVTLLFGAAVATLVMQWLGDFLSDQGIIGSARDSDVVVEVTASTPPTSSLIASSVAVVIIALPWLSDQWRRVLWPFVGLLVLFRVVSSTDSSLDVLIAVALGMAVGSLALLVFGTESSDPEASELVAMLRTRGTPRRIEQLAGSAPLVYAVEMVDHEPMEMRVRTVHDRTENRLERIWRSMRLRTWVNDLSYDTVQQRIEHEALAQRSAADAGARVAPVRDIVASRQGSVGLLEDRVLGGPMTAVAARPAGRPGATTDADVVPDARAVDETDEAGARPADVYTLDHDLVVDVWRQVARLHAARIAHRSLDLHAVWVTPAGQAELRDFDGAAIAATDRDLALDRAQLLVSTALAVGSRAAVDIAVETVGAATVATAVPYLQPLALPAPTRRELRQDRAVLDSLRAAIGEATGVEPAPLARLDRVRPRTVVSLVAFVVAFYVLLPQLGDFGESVDAASQANWWWLGPMLLGAAGTMVFAALSFVAAVPEPIPYLPALRMQVASAFLSRIAPANTGTLAVGVRFLQRAGLEPGPAAAAVGLATLAGFIVHMALLGAFLLWVGSAGSSQFQLPDLSIVFAVLAVVLPAIGLVVGLVPAVRRRVLPPLLAQVRTAASSLADVLTDPVRVIGLIGGSTGVTMSHILTLAAAVAAFDGSVSFPEIGAAYLVAHALGSVAPTPGGLGPVEFALVAALTGYGMGEGSATLAVLTYRLVTFWLPMLPGWFTFHQMQRREEL
jgi:uncharacterized membrane protein YbhN (UPF0104 family)